MSYLPIESLACLGNSGYPTCYYQITPVMLYQVFKRNIHVASTWHVLR